MQNQGAGNDDEMLEQVRSGQKLIIYAIMVNFVAYAARQSPSFALLLYGVALIMAFFGIFRLATGLGFSTIIKVVLSLLQFVPLANIVSLLLLSSRATKALRDGGYQVGLLGASRRD